MKSTLNTQVLVCLKTLSSSILPTKDDDTIDDNEPLYVRTDCDGTWIEHANN